MRAALLLLWLAVAGATDAALWRPSAPMYEVYAIRYGILPAFPASGLIAGADKARTLDIPVMFWLLKGSDGRRVLVDSGFHRQKFIERWKPRDFRLPSDAVRAAGVAPEEITDIILTHAHWDHAGGMMCQASEQRGGQLLGPWPYKRKGRRPVMDGGLSTKIIPAVTYSPTQLPVQYHRR